MKVKGKYIYPALLFLLSAGSSFSQDKGFYLIDSINVKKLYAEDARTLDSVLKIYHASVSDTARVRQLSFLVEKIADETVWPRYNHLLLKKTTVLLEKEKQGTPAYRVFLEEKASALNNEGYYLESYLGNMKQALVYFNECLSIREQLKDKQALAATYVGMGTVYDNLNQLEKALTHYEKALTINKQIGSKEGEGVCYNNIGYVYSRIGNIPLALQYYTQSLKIRESIDDKEGITQGLLNIGHIYATQGDTNASLRCFFRALTISQKTNNKKNEGYCYNNIGALQSQIYKTLFYYDKALHLRLEINDMDGIGNSYNNIGAQYRNLGKYDEALDYFRKSLKIYRDMDGKQGLAYCLGNIADVFYRRKEYKKAIKYADSALILANEAGLPDVISNSARAESIIYEAMGNYPLAIARYKLYIQMRDSLKNDANTKKTVQQQMQYDFDKKESAAKAEQVKKDEIARADAQRQKIIIYAVSAGLFLILTLALVILRSLLQNRKKNRIITEQKRLVELQKELVEEKQKEIVDSIYYARRIQRALLPSDNYVTKHFNRLKHS